MTARQEHIPFETEVTPNLRRLNRHVSVRVEESVAVVWVSGAAWHRFAWDSLMDRRILGANLVLAGLATTVEVVRHLGLSRVMLYRDRRRLVEGGLPALASVRRGPTCPTKVTPQLTARARKLYREGHSKSAIGRKLGLSASTIRRMLRGVVDPLEKAQGILVASCEAPDAAACTPARKADCKDATVSVGEAPGSTEAVAEQRTEVLGQLAHAARTAPVDPSGFAPVEPHPTQTTEADLDRTVERAFARFGLITEASIRFVCGRGMPSVGALLLIPALVATGFFKGIEAVYGKLKNGFYGLRHTVMTLVLMMTLRIRRAQQLAGSSPTALGRLLGLDRAPEVKTLRRRLREIASLGKASELMQWFARHLIEREPEELGFLYVDGHVRPYYGKRKISKAFVSQRRLVMPAATDFWVNGVQGDPVFVVTGEVVSSLSSALIPILEEVRTLVGKDVRVTVVFDRGGWSPKLFRKILDMDFDILTYRKGKCPKYPRKDFMEVSGKFDGREVTYDLRDGFVRPGEGLQLRSVVQQTQDGHQTHVVTSRCDLPAVEVAYRMFERWRQENYFKYVTREFDLDALDTYAVEPDDPERTVPNPARKKLDRQIARLGKQAKELEAELGRAVNANDETQRRTTRGFKIAHSALRQELATVRNRIEQKKRQRDSYPQRVTVAQAHDPASHQDPVKLTVESKHFMNVLKMAVYRAETALFRMLDSHYRANEKEGRALLREAFRSSGALEVKDGYLRVTMDALSAPRRSRAIAALCAELNDAYVRIPGTSLRLQFAVNEDKCIN